MHSTINKTQSSAKVTSSVINFRAVKANTKAKKPFDMHKFLVKHHSEDNVHLFGAINAHWNWVRQIRNSNVANLEGLVIFMSKDDQVLYIGHTSHVGQYVQMNNVKGIKPHKIFIVCNENPSMYTHAVTAYRAKFKPILNSERNQRFIFDCNNTVLNLNTRSEKALEWIKGHANSTRKEFVLVFSVNDLIALCKCFSVNRISYKALKTKIFKVKSNIRVISKEELLSI